MKEEKSRVAREKWRQEEGRKLERSRGSKEERDEEGEEG